MLLCDASFDWITTTVNIYLAHPPNTFFLLTCVKTFPPEIASSHIRTSVNKYEDEMSAALQRSVCCSCGKFIAGRDIYEVEGITVLL
jgi:hypothetical protein